MSENLWEELTRSPLDPDPEYESPLLDSLIPMLIAAIVGIAIGFFLLGHDADSTTTTTEVAATSTSRADPPALPEPEPILPDSYVDAAGVGLRAVAAYGRDGNLYIVVNQAARSDNPPTELPAFHASHWVLTGPGEEQADRVIESPIAPGMRTLEFQGLSVPSVAEAGLLVREATQMVVRAGCQGCGATAVDQMSGETTLDGLQRPHSLAEPLLIEIGSGMTLSIDSLDFTNEWGYVTWHLIDESEARLRVRFRVVFEGTDDPDREDTNPTQLVPVHLLGTSQQNPSPSNLQPFARGGTQQLERVGELITDTNQPSALILRWSVEWQHPVGEPIELPIVEEVYRGPID